jgi:type III secretion system (T3SS) SseB-like protein
MQQNIEPEYYSSVVFLSDQRGPQERKLQAELIREVFSQRMVRRAYLVRVEYPNETRHVALCLAAERSDRERLVESIGRVFRRLFDNHTHMDIMFVNYEQEQQLEKKCTPFFVLND